MTNTVERQREHFNSISARYAESRKHPNHLLLKNLIWSSFFEESGVTADAGTRVLEPMCGMSEGLYIVKRHLQENIEYTGFDYSEEMVAIARQENPTAQIAHLDATAYASNGDSFNWIILIGGLHHVYSSAEDVVNRLAEALPKGGYFLNFEPTQNCWLTRRIRQRIYEKNALFDQESEQGFDLVDLDGIFLRAGFEKAHQVFPGLLSYVLFYNPDAFPWLNVGGQTTVRTAFAVDKFFWRTWLGRKLSFATITLWRKS